MDDDRKKNFNEPTIAEEASLADVTLQTGFTTTMLGWPDIGTDV